MIDIEFRALFARKGVLYGEGVEVKTILKDFSSGSVGSIRPIHVNSFAGRQQIRERAFRLDIWPRQLARF